MGFASSCRAAPTNSPPNSGCSILTRPRASHRNMHAELILADDTLAYVGSAILLQTSAQASSLENGFLVERCAVNDVARPAKRDVVGRVPAAKATWAQDRFRHAR